MAEFTGERVIPGQVDVDLWNEHVSRYLFASRLCRNKRVLDLACGTGYGASYLAATAAQVVGVDIAADAVEHATAHYGKPNITFLAASVTGVPLPDASFDLITAFEVIEHLEEPRALLAEARRLLAPGGQFIVSTPNKAYYAESRKQAGPNPFHTHEFEFDEFRQLLQEYFASASMFVQNHSSGVVFQPMQPTTAAELKLEATAPEPVTSNFFLAVCAQSTQTGGPAFIYVPTAANVLREREQHIARLEQELSQKDSWLEKSKTEHGTLVELHEAQRRELELRNRWAQKLNDDLAATANRVAELQDELAREQASARETVAAYEAKIAELDAENLAKTQWAHETETRLSAEIEAKQKELLSCVDLLNAAEKTVEERTLWAQDLEKQREQLEARLSMVHASRWHKLGRRFGLGPEVSKS